MADTPHRLATMARADGTGRILNDRDVAFPRLGQNVVHGGGKAEEMDGHNRACPWRDRGCKRPRIKVVGRKVNIGENGLGPDVLRAMGRRDPSESWNDDFVART